MAAAWADLDEQLHIIEIADLVTRNLEHSADAGRGRSQAVR
jgi:hypothetical protein